MGHSTAKRKCTAEVKSSDRVESSRVEWRNAALVGRELGLDHRAPHTCNLITMITIIMLMLMILGLATWSPQSNQQNPRDTLGFGPRWLVRVGSGSGSGLGLGLGLAACALSAKFRRCSVFRWPETKIEPQFARAIWPVGHLISIGCCSAYASVASVALVGAAAAAADNAHSQSQSQLMDSAGDSSISGSPKSVCSLSSVATKPEPEPEREPKFGRLFEIFIWLVA